jgi:hypothetical protein
MLVLFLQILKYLVYVELEFFTHLLNQCCGSGPFLVGSGRPGQIWILALINKVRYSISTFLICVKAINTLGISVA